MRALFEMDEGLRRLREIIGSFPPESVHWNEAQNRFQFVDRILTECLGWEHPDIKVEDTDYSGDRADYVMGNPAKAILEAKREAKIWNIIPSGHTGTVRKLKPLVMASKDFKEVVIQVIPYCSLRGAPIAIVCNGPQLAIFQAITIGQEPLDGECYLFNGFQSYLNDFALLWTLLSPEGVTENRAFRELARYRNPRIPPKASQAITEPNRYRYRDELQEEIQSLASLLLEEIEDDPDLKEKFYKECYVPIEANNRHLLLSKKLIGQRYKRVSTENVNPSSLDKTQGAEQLGEKYSSGAGSRPIVVIGDIGVGKTSFFENLHLSIPEKEKSNTYFINVDLGKKANLSASLKSHILAAIPNSLKRQYGIDIFDAEFVNSIYYDEIRSFDRSVDGQLKKIDNLAYQKEKIRFLKLKIDQADNHLHVALGHIVKGRKKKILLILDNADQRRFEVQQEAFLIAQELAATRNLIVFVALRPSTFYLSKTSGTLAAYQNKILTISPPPADQVIQKRLTFALRVAEGKVAPASLEGIRLNLANIVAFLRSTLRSVRQNDDIRQFLGNIAGGNTRAVIELITSFCGSPNVDARKIVRIETQTKNYKVPLHEFTKHALLGEFSYYNPQSSLVAANVFDVSMADSREHFLSSLVIGYLSANTGKRDNDGFVSGEAIIVEMARHGFLEEQSNNCLVRLASRRLIETPHSHYREIQVPDSTSPQTFQYRATSIGLYHTRFWLASFSFLDATAIDTPIFDEDTREKIGNLAASFEIKDRYMKATAFRAYLENKWHQASFDVNYFDFPTVVIDQSRSFELVERVAHEGKTRRMKR